MSGYIWQHRLVDYTYVELIVVQRASRIRRDVLMRERTALEERIIRGGHDGEMMELHRAHGPIDSEVRTLDDVVRKHWNAIVNRGQPP